MINWDDIRKQFPVTENSTYLNAAAAGPLSRATMAAATEYYQQMMDDGDTHWDEWLAKREEVRRKVAAFINAEPDEIALTTNTSSGMNVIVDALETHGEVISCDLEFPVSTLPWMNRRIPVHLVKSVEGEVRIDDIRDAMNVRTGVICLSHVQYSNGLRVDLEELGNAKGGHALVVNASQSAGAFEIDVKRMKIDALCATGPQVDALGLRQRLCLSFAGIVGAIEAARDRLAERRRSLLRSKRRNSSAPRCGGARRAWLSTLRRHVCPGRVGRTDYKARHQEYRGARAGAESISDRSFD